MTILLGAHIEGKDVVGGAALRGAEAVQVNLSAPRNWRAPLERKDAAELLAWDVPVFVHAPYLVNPASLNPEVRAKSRQALVEQLAAAERIGAKGLVVHGGHPTGTGTMQDGIDGWVEVLSGLEHTVPILVENTAGGKAAVARRLDDLKRLWDALQGIGANVGYCLDTCHAHAGGEDLDGLVERTLAVTGRVDVVHLNGSKDLFDSSRDRHASLEDDGANVVDLGLLSSVVSEAHELAAAPAILETPGGVDVHRSDLDIMRTRLGL